ncbi:type II toxin-antitoxin system prevent-host-death family antitoxin [Lonepinella sp. MS14437]|uniref:type II toxin-antitoxin system prevent-host-death family antitoxin n=1 Tax=Lonepinella sp. MS14437 TaxID=3003620 RepID=UPI0036D975F4
MMMTSREFNQHLSQAQKAAQIEPVIITNRGEPSYVLMKYTDYQQQIKTKPFRSALTALTPTVEGVGDIELELQLRSTKQRQSVNFED